MQGLGSIIYHQCPNNTTKGIDVIPMQATALLAVHYILIKIFIRKIVNRGQPEFKIFIRKIFHRGQPEFETGGSFITTSHNETEASDIPIENSPIAAWCKKNIEHIISGVIFVIQILLIILTICLQFFTSHQNVTIPVIIAFLLYIGACSVTSIFMCIETKKWPSKVGCILTAIAILTFIGGGICFGKFGSTKTSGESWESREKNSDCWIGMFDQHDLWHFLVATSLGFQIYRLWSCCGQLDEDEAEGSVSGGTGEAIALQESCESEERPKEERDSLILPATLDSDSQRGRN